MKTYLIFAVTCGLVFAGLLFYRLDFPGTLFSEKAKIKTKAPEGVEERDTWRNILQNGKKIGYSHSTFSKIPEGFIITEDLFMRINTMGMIQDLRMETGAQLNRDYTLSSVEFTMESGRFAFTAKGRAENGRLKIVTDTGEDSKTMVLDIPQTPYLMTGIYDMLNTKELVPEKTYTFDIFAPAVMDKETVRVVVKGKENVHVMGEVIPATHLQLDFRGITQDAWISDEGEVLKEEGLLGITLVKSTKKAALFGLGLHASEDLTKVASVPASRPIPDPDSLTMIRVSLFGVNTAELDLDGGRQSFSPPDLIIQKESLSNIGTEKPDTRHLQQYLEADNFIRSDHKKIRTLVNSLISEKDSPMEKAEKIFSWVFQKIEKRPVLSMPDSISTLENRVGDCNEHSVLLASMMRAAGIPAEVEVGLVYLNGAFYYHAWNRVFLGRWITMDSVFGQMPADVTHIRVARGTGKSQLNLAGLIGRLKEIEIREMVQ